MDSQTKVATNEENINEFHDLIIDSITDIKGKQIRKFDLRKLEEAPTDFFIICEGDSSTQVKSIAGNIQKRLRNEMDIRVSYSEGQDNSNWICLDYFTTVVHVFFREARDFYQLDALWNDADITEYDSL